MKTKQPIELLQNLATNGGAIITSAECSIIEIADAQATGRWAVDDDGIGYVLRYPEWLARHRKCSSEPQLEERA